MIEQLDVITSPVGDFYSWRDYTRRAKADDECRRNVHVYKKMVRGLNLDMPYYAITNPESYARLKSVFESGGFRAENLPRIGIVSSTKNFTRH